MLALLSRYMIKRVPDLKRIKGGEEKLMILRGHSYAEEHISKQNHEGVLTTRGR